MVGALFGWGSSLVSHWPLRLRYRLAAVVGVLNYALRPHLRRQALRNYAAILKLPPGDPRVRRTTRAAFAGYTKLLVDFLVLPTMTPRQRARQGRHRGGWKTLRPRSDRVGGRWS